MKEDDAQSMLPEAKASQQPSDVEHLLTSGLAQLKRSARELAEPPARSEHAAARLLEQLEQHLEASLISECSAVSGDRVEADAAEFIEALQSYCERHALDEDVDPMQLMLQRHVARRDQRSLAALVQEHNLCMGELQAVCETQHQDLGALCTACLRFGFAAVSINVYHKDTNRLEKAGIVGRDARVGSLKRGIPDDELLRDIEVDVLKRSVVERIQGDDPRYDQIWVERGGHNQCYKDRCFVCLVVAVDRFGNLQQDGISWELVSSVDGRTVWQYRTADDGLELRPVGTLSLSADHIISDVLIEELLGFATSTVAQAAYATILQHTVEKAASKLVQFARADSGSIHCVSFGNALDYYRQPVGERDHRGATNACHIRGHRVAAGRGRPGELGGTPRPNGIGVQALIEDQTLWLEGDELKEQNPQLHREGIAKVLVVPLKTRAGVPIGILYLHWHSDRAINFDPVHLELLQGLLQTAGSMIIGAAQTVNKTRRDQQRLDLDQMSQDVFDELLKNGNVNERDVVDKLTKTISTHIGADLVAIYHGQSQVVSAQSHSRVLMAQVNDSRLQQLLLHGHPGRISGAVIRRVHRGLRRAFKVSLCWHGCPVGSMLVAYGDRNDFETQYLKRVADLVSTALRGIDLDVGMDQAKDSFRHTLGEAALEQVDRLHWPNAEPGEPPVEPLPTLH